MRHTFYPPPTALPTTSCPPVSDVLCLWVAVCVCMISCVACPHVWRLLASNVTSSSSRTPGLLSFFFPQIDKCLFNPSWCHLSLPTLLSERPPAVAQRGGRLTLMARLYVCVGKLPYLYPSVSPLCASQRKQGCYWGCFLFFWDLRTHVNSWIWLCMCRAYPVPFGWCVF